VERKSDRPKGILRPATLGSKAELGRYSPSADLAPFVEHYWVVKWSLPGQESYRSENLPYPSVHFVVEPQGAYVQGVHTERFTYTVSGTGRVFGVKFRPGGFHPFSNGPIARLTDRRAAPAEVFGAPGERLAQEIASAESPDGWIGAAEGFFRALRPSTDSKIDLVAGVIDYVMACREVTRVSDILERFGMSARTLQHLFSHYVGVGPKWVIRRYRIIEAVERLHASGRIDTGQLALDLGYADQAHFIKDFKGMTGTTPAQYNRENRARG